MAKGLYEVQCYVHGGDEHIMHHQFQTVLAESTEDAECIVADTWRPNIWVVACNPVVAHKVNAKNG